MSKIAVVLIRGLIGIRHDIKETIFMLNLKKKHACVVIEDTPVYRGMLKKIQSYVAFGEITEETEKLLVEKREAKRKDGSVKKYYSLAPPKGGFERKGIKKSFIEGGALGNRGDKMNDLIARMV